jgi:TP901-1 family phage major tail protein
MALTSVAQGGKNFLLKMGNGASGAVTFTATSDLVGKVAHGFVVGQRIRFATVVTSTVAAIATDYYVISAGLTADAFKISTTRGGSTINIDADGTGTLLETYDSIAGSRTLTASLGAEAIEITNHDSSQFKELLDASGIKSASLSVDGVFYDDVSLQLAEVVLLAQSLRNWRVYFNGTDTDYLSGSFKLTSLERSGDYNNEQSWSISLESSGSFSVTRA